MTLQTRMIDVGGKDDTQRQASAHAVVRLRPDVMQMIQEGRIPKGNVLEVARIAGILAAKQTPHILPLCHPLNITSAEVSFDTSESGEIHITSTVRCVGKTGVEMEALTAASVAALTIYDMCKTVQKDIEIGEIHLLEKSGGKTGDYRKAEE